MVQKTTTVLLRGGLNLITPPIAMAPGQASAALNYEPEVRGYSRIGGHERFDGRVSPSDASTTADATIRRNAIQVVPGSGPVRGVCVYNGALYAFRDSALGEGKMFKSTTTLGWVEQTFGHFIDFTAAGTTAPVEGATLVGFTSAASARIKRVVQLSGAYSNSTAAGYLVLSELVGTFIAETGNSGPTSMTLSSVGTTTVALSAGGRYECITHNFYGAAKTPRMYFANGIGQAFEWDGLVLAPIRTGTDTGTLEAISYLLDRNGDTIIIRNSDRVALRGQFDKPTHVGHFKNHLWLGYEVGAIIHSGIGEPLDYRTAAGAGEISFGAKITNFMTAASSSFVVFGDSRVEYITGNDSLNFVMAPISDEAGAAEWTASTGGDQPLYLDEAGVRKLSTTAAFGDWRMGTITQMVEPLFRKKREDGVLPVTSISVRTKDQYRLFFDDNSGVIMYLGAKNPETFPFLYPFKAFCSAAGEFTPSDGERYFVGAADGYVYELDKGSSFDGGEVQAYIRLPWANQGGAYQEKRYHKVTFEVDAPDAIQMGVAFHVDYAIPGNNGGTRQNIDMDSGSTSLIPIADYDTIDFSQPIQVFLEAHIDGIGRNCAVTLVSEHIEQEPHTLSAMTLNFSPRRGIR